MPTIQLNPTSQRTLEFEGELVLGTSSPEHQTENGRRRYELALYKQSAGGFVVEIRFHTTCPNERSCTQVEVVDDAKDIENVLLLFDACECVDKRSLNEDQRTRLRKTLYRVYDEQVARLLTALTEHAAEWQSEVAATADQAEPAKKRGLLSFLRLK